MLSCFLSPQVLGITDLPRLLYGFHKIFHAFPVGLVNQDLSPINGEDLLRDDLIYSSSHSSPSRSSSPSLW